jgi:hypothetical protein
LHQQVKEEKDWGRDMGITGREQRERRKSTGRKKLGFLLIDVFPPTTRCQLRGHRNIVVGQARLQKEPNRPTRLKVYYRN